MRWKRATGAVLAATIMTQPIAAQTDSTAPAPEKASTQKPEGKETGSARAEALRTIDVWLDAQQAYDHVPALSAAIVRGDAIVWSKGYGTIDAAHTVPATATTIYSICSISKLFTSVALMQQWEAGKVSLDAPLTTYLPWAALKPVTEDSVPITLRGALTHSAGLPREADFPYWSGPDYPFPTQAEIRAMIGKQAPLFPASRWFQYSNLGLTLVGDTVEAVSGTPYADYVQAHILGPLALKDTHPFMPMQLYGTRLAVGWGALDRKGERPLLKPFDARGIQPAAGFTSTAEDLARFAIWQFRLLRTGTPEILKASTLREMQRVQFTSPDWKTTWGLGFSVRRRDGQTYVGHGGDCPGYHTNLSMRPETETAVVTMATGAENPGPYGNAMFALLDKRRTYAFKAPAPVAVDLEAYAGHYAAQPWQAETVVLPWAGGLAVMDLPTRDPAGDLDFLKPKGGDLFRAVRDDGSEADEVRFERDARGKVIRMIRFSNPETKTGGL